jgi:O-acetyl-ADP-ribose deacetylase (regulator of RNase III)
LIRVLVGELSAQVADAVVRPVRSDLAPVTSASRLLEQRAGERFGEHMAKIGPLPLGGAVITPSGDLPASFVIHVVVMSEDEPQTPMSIQRALRNGLRRAVDLGLDSLALPPLGLGVGTTEPEVSARALVDILFNHLDEGSAPLDLTIVAGSEFEADLFRRLVDDPSRNREPPAPG